MKTPKFGMMDKLRCKVSGFEGTVMSITEYATGCLHYGLCPPVDKDGKLQDWQHIDETRLVLLQSGVVECDNTGGPAPNPPQW